MFIRPTGQELKNFKPDWTILNACKATNPDYAKLNMRSDLFVAFNMTEQMIAIGGTWYGERSKRDLFRYELCFAASRHRIVSLFGEYG